MQLCAYLQYSYFLRNVAYCQELPSTGVALTTFFLMYIWRSLLQDCLDFHKESKPLPLEDMNRVLFLL